MPGPAQLSFHVPEQTTILLGCGVMEGKLKEGNRIKGSYALVSRYGGEEGVAWMPDLVDWLSSRGGRGTCVHVCSLASQKDKVQSLCGEPWACHRGCNEVRLQASPQTGCKRLARNPKSLKECFVKKRMEERGKKRRRERRRERGGRKRCVRELNNTWFDMKSLLLPPRRSPARKDVREASRETPTNRNKTCLVPGLRSKQIKMNWCKLSDFGE